MSTELRPEKSASKAKKVTTHRLTEMKANGEKISMLTAYDYSFARIIDDAGIDVILVGDSASNVIHGHETTLPITRRGSIVAMAIDSFAADVAGLDYSTDAVLERLRAELSPMLDRRSA